MARAPRSRARLEPGGPRGSPPRAHSHLQLSRPPRLLTLSPMKRAAILTCSVLLGLGASCVFVHARDDSPPREHDHSHATTAAAHGAVATANIESRSGSTLTGKATFTETTGG